MIYTNLVSYAGINLAWTGLLITCMGEIFKESRHSKDVKLIYAGAFCLIGSIHNYYIRNSTTY